MTIDEIWNILHLEIGNEEQSNTISSASEQINADITPGESYTQICQKLCLNIKKKQISFLIASNAWLQLHQWQERNISESDLSEQPP